MKKILSLILAAAMLCCILAGCGKPQEEPVETEEPQIETPEPSIINPLTGEEVSEDISAARPYCVMINNHKEGRPSIGLSNASIIYEALVESDITRLMAIFNDVDGLDIGNVRSCRHYYLSLAQAYDALYIHWGSSDIGDREIAEYNINDLDALGDDAGFYRERFRSQNEHNAMIHGSQAVKFAEAHYETKHADGYDTTYGLLFSDDAVKQCTEKSTDFTVQYLSSTKTEFKYNEERGCYNAYMGGTEYIDRRDYNDSSDDTPIDLANVIILNVPFTVLNDKSAHKDMSFVGSGTGYFATGGKYVEINWTRADREDSFHYTLTDGTPLELSVGTSYICIVPIGTGGSVTW